MSAGLPTRKAHESTMQETEMEKDRQPGHSHFSTASEETKGTKDANKGASRSSKKTRGKTDNSGVPTEPSVHPEVLYSIACRDPKAKRRKQYVLSENPFEEVSPNEQEIAQSPMVIKVFLRVYGIGSSSDWDIDLPMGGMAPGVVRRRDPVPVYDDYNYSPVRRTASPDSEDERSLYTDSSINTGSARSSDAENDDARGRFRLNRKATFHLDSVSDLGEFRATGVVVKSIHIHSKNLITLFHNYIREYPTQSFKGEKVVVESPFRILAHYYKDLLALKESESSVESDSAPETTKITDSTQVKKYLDAPTKCDLSVLLNYFQRHYVKDFEPEEAKYDTGVCSYSLLWFLFKPGCLVYARLGGKLAGYVFERGEETSGRRNQRFEWLAHCWNLTFNGRRLVRTFSTFKIRKFHGVKSITAMPVFPAKYLDSVDGGKTAAKLQELGHKFHKILRASPAHMYYTGLAWNMDDGGRGDDGDPGYLKLKPNIDYTGEIILDFRRDNSFLDRRGRGPPRPPPIRIREDSIASDEEESDEDDEEPRELVPLDTRSPRKSFHPINPKDQENLTPLLYFLLPRRMYGFAVASKQSLGFDVENIKPIHWPPPEADPMSTLILGESDKDVIKALARKYTKHQGSWGADFIAGKGEGQIFLLHGPPGTGKTYTVECVAKYTRRPLLRLTVADIGTNEREMEDILGEWFRRGADWGAIILIDEADVFLEKRQVKDLQRNSLVSVFLSSMEYYTGMLFLTTNRIGQIDDAFLSRTSVALTYETLTIGKQRRIWEGFLKKLGDERKDISLTDRAKKFLEGLDKDETTKNVPWNGREIRNALQTAIALATHDAEKEAEELGVRATKIIVRDEHFQAVVDRRKDFITYRKSIKNQDEDARAFVAGDRPLPQKR